MPSRKLYFDTTGPIDDECDSPLSLAEARARIRAARGLSLLKAADFERARSLLVEASVLDPAIDFRRLPDFWELSGQAHEEIVQSLYDVDRRRDAIQMVADLRVRFRPRLVSVKAS